METKIHRGAHEIGGSCVEVASSGQRIVLDVGRPLSAGKDEISPLPDVAGLEDSDPSLLGILITHAHQDHWGLVGQVAPGVPIFMGEATARILSEAAFWTQGLVINPAGFLRHREPFELGPFRITPYLNDHSAFDAYSLLVEAEGRKLFYTGDIRGHGRKSGMFEELLRKPPAGVDVLLCEGTNIRPGDDSPEAQVSETDLEDAMVQTMKSTDGMVLVVSSAQNIDRLVTIYRAALRSGRELVVDLYGASIAEATRNPNIPHPGPDWPKVHVYVPQWQRIKVKSAKAFERVGKIRGSRVYEAYLAENRSKLVTFFSAASGQRLADAGCLEGAVAIWSLWPGYLKQGSGLRLTAFLESQHIRMVQHHTSGHASVADLQRLAIALSPRKIVPIHSFATERYPEFFKDVTLETDGAWWQV